MEHVMGDRKGEEALASMLYVYCEWIEWITGTSGNHSIIFYFFFLRNLVYHIGNIKYTFAVIRKYIILLKFHRYFDFILPLAIVSFEKIAWKSLSQ